MLEDVIEFIEACFNRDMILNVLLGYCAGWFSSRMILIVGRGWVQLFAWSGFDVPASLPREARRATVEDDALAVNEELAYGTVADLGLSHVFSQLSLPERPVHSLGITIGARVAVVVVGASGSPSLDLDDLQRVCRTAGAQLETVIRLTKSGELPTRRIPDLPKARVSPRSDDDGTSDSSDGAPQMTLDVRADDSNDDLVVSAESTTFGLPFVRVPLDDASSSSSEPSVSEPSELEFAKPGLAPPSDLSESSVYDDEVGRPKGTKTVTLPEVSETSLGAPASAGADEVDEQREVEPPPTVSSTLVGTPRPADISDEELPFAPVGLPASSGAEDDASDDAGDLSNDSSGVRMMSPIALTESNSVRTQLGVTAPHPLATKPTSTDPLGRAKSTNLGGITVEPELQEPRTPSISAPGSMILKLSKKLRARSATPHASAAEDAPVQSATRSQLETPEVAVGEDGGDGEVSEPVLEVAPPSEPSEEVFSDLDLDHDAPEEGAAPEEAAQPAPGSDWSHEQKTRPAEVDAFFDFFAEQSEAERSEAKREASQAQIVTLSEMSDEPLSLPPETLDRILDSGPEMVDTQELYLSLDSRDPVRAFEAAEEVAALGPKAVEVLESMFPGRIVLDRYQLGDELPPAEEHGAVLHALVRIGEPSLSVVERYLDDASIEARFYAVLLLTRLDATEMIPQLVERLFDRDQQIRHVASDLIAQYHSTDYFQSHVVDRLHDELNSGDDLHATVAAEVLGRLKLRYSIAALIEAMDDASSSRLKVKIRDALQAITLHDCSSPYEWRQWWAKARSQSREAWIVEALDATSAKLRNQAYAEVQRIPGLELNYHPDQPSKLRQRSQKVLREWLAANAPGHRGDE